MSESLPPRIPLELDSRLDSFRT
nr:InfA [Sida fallax]WJK72994.1 InfA [Sida fallax]